MELKVYTKQGALAGRSIDVPDSIFAVEPNEHVVYLAVQSQRTNSRQGTRATKNRSMVSGGGRKPWKQKGRGTARSGTNRSPIWRGGGTVFGPKQQDFNYNLPKKVKKLARISVLSDKVKNERVKILENFSVDEAKTKEMFGVLKGFELTGSKTLVLVPEYDEKILLASRNIKNLKVAMAADASTYELLDCQTLLIMEGAIEKLEGVLA
jgi:large subunit ribosomal protein L4